MRRITAALILIATLSACGGATRDLAEPTEPLGDFKLGHVGVVAPNLQKLLVSRDATKEEWIAEVDGAMETRFRRFAGDRFYHLGISVEAYSLPPPIVPGKSALALNVTVWDDAAQAKLNPEPEQIHVIKVFESRLTKNRDEQMQGLAEEAALQIEKWLREQQAAEGWFESSEVPKAADAEADTPPSRAAAETAPASGRTAVRVPQSVLDATNAAAGTSGR